MMKRVGLFGGVLLTAKAQHPNAQCIQHYNSDRSGTRWYCSGRGRMELEEVLSLAQLFGWYTSCPLSNLSNVPVWPCCRRAKKKKKLTALLFCKGAKQHERKERESEDPYGA
ncbi:MAG: hypothetical protein J3Q66DRAFT_338648, partial [Benniella sp.]